jgi:hypothetical protein
MLRKKELDWFYEGGAAAIFPDGLYFFVLCSINRKKNFLKHYQVSRQCSIMVLATYINYVKSVSEITVEFK